MILFASLVVVSDDYSKTLVSNLSWNMQSLPRVGEFVIVRAKNEPQLLTRVKHVIHIFEADFVLGGKVVVAVTPIDSTEFLEGLIKT